MAKPFKKKEETKFTIKEGGGAESQTSKDRTTQDRLAELEAEILSERATPISPSSNQVPARAGSSGKEPKTRSMSLTDPRSLFESHDTRKKLMLLCGIVLFSVIVSQLPFAGLFFTPLNQFTTMVHEMGHALAAIFTGGSVSGMTIVADGAGHGGLTRSLGGIDLVVVQAGYLGTAIFGCFLVYLSQFPKLSKGILIGIGCIVALASLFFMGPGIFSMKLLEALFSMVWGFAMAAFLIFAGLKLKDNYANLVLLFLAMYTSMDSLRSIWIVLNAALFGADVTSDATTMQSLFFLPAIFWSFLWAVISILMLAGTIWLTYGRGSKLEKLLQSKGTGIIKR